MGVCRYCGDSVSDPLELELHEGVHRGESLSDDGFVDWLLADTTGWCKWCNHRFDNAELLAVHESMHRDQGKRSSGSDTYGTIKRSRGSSDISSTCPAASTQNERAEASSSKMSSRSTLQTGGGDQPDRISYTIRHVGQKTFKNLVIDREYVVKFNVNTEAETQRMADMYRELENMFQDIVAQSTRELEAHDLVKLTIRHSDLHNDVHIPLQPKRRMTSAHIMEYLQNVLNSYQSMAFDSSFHVDLATLQLPSGKGWTHTIDQLIDTPRVKRSLFLIKNNDEQCLVKATLIGFFHKRTVITKEWHVLTTVENRTSMSIEELVLTMRQCPGWYYTELKRQCSQLNKLVSALLLRLPNTYPTTLQDIAYLEDYLAVDILVVSSRLGKKFIKVAPENSNRSRVYLYLIDDERIGHYSVLLNVCGFFGSSSFCEHCLIPYRKNQHQCTRVCFACHRQNCKIDVVNGQVSCRSCHLTCRSTDCFDSHKAIGNQGGKSSCSKVWKCTTCKKVIQLKRRNTPHFCEEMYCKCCRSHVNKDHRCHIRALAEPKPLHRFLFFDFECIQSDNVLMCVEGYDADKQTNCQTCSIDINCVSCRTCRNCRQSWCGRLKHVPNVAVVQTVCEHCFNSNAEMCHTCGKRCKKCNLYDVRKKLFRCPPCQGTCGQREVVFEGMDTITQFGRYIFQPSKHGFTSIAHNLKSYDSYFIMQYILSQGIKPSKVVYSGSNILYIHIEEGINMRFVDSLNFLPMRLAYLPDAFNLTERAKGFFPHFFNRQEFQDYEGAYPDASYYDPDSMSTNDRRRFYEWYREKKEKDEVFNFRDEIVKYCSSDVSILKDACMVFRQLLLDITTGGYANSQGIDPFTCITIAGVCSKVFRTMFLKEKLSLRISENQWLPAFYFNGKTNVLVENRWTDSEEVPIMESKFISSPLAQYPSGGYVQRDTFSKKSIQWLEWTMKTHRDRGLILNIRHALRGGGEYTLPNSRYKCDGYEAERGMVLMYDGCWFHGCSMCFPHDRMTTKSKRTGQSMSELYNLTWKRNEYIRAQGLKLVTIWEHEFDKILKTDVQAARYVSSLDIQERLNPRDAFFGGRCETTRMHYKVKDGERINYGT